MDLNIQYSISDTIKVNFSSLYSIPNIANVYRVKRFGIGYDKYVKPVMCDKPTQTGIQQGSFDPVDK